MEASPRMQTPVVTAKGAVTVVEATRAEQALIRRVAESRATVPDVEIGAVVDASAWAGHDAARIPTPALVRAAATALREHPRANAAYRDGHFELYERVNVAVVMPAADGYAAPTLFDADRRSPPELADELERLGLAAAAGELVAADLAGATFTVANLGARHVTRASVIPVPPQAAALAAGAIRAVPVVRDDRVVPGLTAEL